MKIKTSELTGENLGYAVALIEYPEWKEQGYLESIHDLHFDDGDHYAPWKNWHQGGPIIEKQAIDLSRAGRGWYALIAPSIISSGSTPLEAAMRAFVLAKLGNTIEIPE
jgi:hypothetical protein